MNCIDKFPTEIPGRPLTARNADEKEDRKEKTVRCFFFFGTCLLEMDIEIFSISMYDVCVVCTVDNNVYIHIGMCI